MHKNIFRAVKIALLTLVVLASGAVAAGAIGGGGPNGDTGAIAAPSDVAVAAAADVGQAEEYTGITPCRVLDTRTSSPITNTTRSFDVSGTLSGQGGNDACGIPPTATSIAINLTGISASQSTGFVRGWAAGGAPVTATLLNFSPALNASNMVNIPLCAGDPCPDAFTLQVFGSAHLVGDAVGYFQAPMYALVSSSGGVYADGSGSYSSGVVSATRNGTGQYTVLFERRVAGCAVTTSDTVFSGMRDVSADTTGGDPNAVSVVVTNEVEDVEDTFFSVAVHC